MKGSGPPQKGGGFWQNKQASEALYGTCTNRPQDKDPGLRKELMTKNITMTSGAGDHKIDTRTKTRPADYCLQLENFVERSVLPSLLNTNLATKTNVMELLTDFDAQKSALHDIANCEVIGIDLEFHQEHSYDGYICIVSASTVDQCYVFDAIHPINRNYLKGDLTKTLESPYVLKILCGMDNDVLRLQKDWQCYMIGAVDLQDMFHVWKIDDYDNCYSESRNHLRDLLISRKKCHDPQSIRSLFDKYEKPGLDFLLGVLVGNSIPKNKVATMADWRVRPLHKDLLSYIKTDTSHLLPMFYSLYKKIGVDGLRKAYRLGLPKLTKIAKLQMYRLPSLPNTEVAVSVRSWWESLALALDRNPNTILKESHTLRFVTAVEAWKVEQPVSGTPNIDGLEQILIENRVGLVNFRKAAKYLSFHLDPALKASKSESYCNNCGRKGHVAWFCPYPKDKSMVKNVYNQQQFKEQKARQSTRRFQNWCRNKGLPSTTVATWKK